MRFLLSRAAALAFLAAMVLFTGCDSTSDPEDPMDTFLNAVRQSTQPFLSSAAVTAAGYSADAQCVAHPTAGGMGVNE